MHLVFGTTNDEQVINEHPMIVQNMVTRGIVGKNYSSHLAVQAVRAGADVIYIETAPSATPYLLFQALVDAGKPGQLDVMQYLGQSYPGLNKAFESGVRWYGPSEDLKDDALKKHYLNSLVIAMSWLMERAKPRGTPLVIFLNNVGATLESIPDCLLDSVFSCKKNNISFVITESDTKDINRSISGIADCKIFQHSSESIEKTSFHHSEAVVYLRQNEKRPTRVIHDSVNLKIQSVGIKSLAV